MPSNGDEDDNRTWSAPEVTKKRELHCKESKTVSHNSYHCNSSDEINDIKNLKPNREIGVEPEIDHLQTQIKNNEVSYTTLLDQKE